MNDTTNSIASTKRARTSYRPVLIALTASFLLGGAVIGYGTYRYLGAQNKGASDGERQDTALLSGEAQPADLATASPMPTPRASATNAARQAAAVERVVDQQGGIDQRLAAAEQRLARLDLQAQAAAGNTARAEGLLIAFATRRAIEKGAELGFLADQLRLRFGDAMPNAVRTIIDSSRDPITLDMLTARLDGLAPSLAEPDKRFSWDLVRSELSQLFVVRRESTPSPQPERRLDRARMFLESGRTEAAIAEVRNLPGANNATQWIASAERYAATQRALDLIETAAVLEPRRLRDGAGNRIEQASPVQGAPEV
ncbi:hypothetical protein GCM10022600_23710 [Qipengyuania pelagi]|jgi:hypothetical protein|uniref:Inner membrane protein n=1 Tax=Qipengyuania pelagi TaxID=994320 RepID=A0A844Y6X1_9SPHN|nr:hypothetical protein [Qipengyuania pelagi]MXO52788.1 hypothetical protein [Qipengyuania pelagi]